MTENQLLELLHSLSVEEKAAQISQIPLSMCAGGFAKPTGPMAEQHLTPEQVVLCGSLICDQPADAEKAASIVRDMTARHPHHIPPILMRDVIHGCRSVFPIPLALGCTFDESLAEEMGVLSAEEAVSSGYHATFAPMVDVVRDPRWGRVMESPGEAPALCGGMGAAMVRGFRKGGVAACAKHFAGYGLCGSGLDYSPGDVSRTEMFNTYLPPFKDALDEGCEMVMPAFMMVDRVPCVCNPWLLKDVLRDKWHSDALAISDYDDIRQLMYHDIAADKKEAARLALTGGTDMDMMSFAYLAHLPALIESGEVTMEQLDEACLRVLRLKNKLGLFENPVWCDDNARMEETCTRAAHREAALEAALRSCVLMKNESALPLKAGTKAALLGHLADSRDLLGSWSLDGLTAEVKTLREALSGDSRLTFTDTDAADVILYTMGETQEESGEGTSKVNPVLPAEQLEELRQLAATGKPVIVLLFCGRPLILTEALPHAAALLNLWFPGTMGAEAVRRLLMGDANPSGHLSMTFPRSVGQIPIHHDHLTASRLYNGGAPYSLRYLDEQLSPLFPFGFGLSYTTFALQDAAVQKAADDGELFATVTVNVSNTGSVAGETVVQLYARHEGLSVVQPKKRLAAWARVALAPGESKTITLKVLKKRVALWDYEGNELPISGKCRFYLGFDSEVTPVEVLAE